MSIDIAVPVLSGVDLNYFSELTVNSFDLSLKKKIDPNDKELILEFILNNYHQNDLYTFFVPSNLVNLTETIFSNELIRSFVMDYSEILSFQSSINELNFEALINTIINGVYKNKVKADSSVERNKVLMYENINSTIAIDDLFEFKSILENNFWLLAFYVLMIYFPNSETYKKINKDLN